MYQLDVMTCPAAWTAPQPLNEGKVLLAERNKHQVPSAIAQSALRTLPMPHEDLGPAAEEGCYEVSWMLHIEAAYGLSSNEQSWVQWRLPNSPDMAICCHLLLSSKLTCH